MTEAAPRRWTVEEFFAWQERQPERYELVEGFPVRMMAGAKNFDAGRVNREDITRMGGGPAEASDES